MKFSKALLYFKVGDKGMQVGDLLKKCGFKRTYFYKRLNNPSSFSLGDINKIKNALDLSLSEVNEIFFGCC